LRTVPKRSGLAFPGPNVCGDQTSVFREELRARNLVTLHDLAETNAGTVLVGHGEPWTGGARAIVDQARAAGIA